MQVVVEAGNINLHKLSVQWVVEMQVDLQPMLRPVLLWLHHNWDLVSLKWAKVCLKNINSCGKTIILQTDDNKAQRAAFCPAHVWDPI